ncbi:MAG TPA: tetratricopeptide repeat protein [Drouetiella sp.]
MSRKILTGLALLISAVCSPAAQSQNFEQYQPAISPQQAARASGVYQQALQAFSMGDDSACINLCRQAENFSHGDKNIFHLEALAYARAGDNYNAMLKFRSALTLDYNFVPCRNNYGIFLKKTGKDTEAMRKFEECIKIDPSYADAYYHLGEIYHDKGDLDKAIDMFETATRKNPNYVDAQKDLGLAIYERYSSGQGGSINDSIEKLQIAEKLMPTNPIIHYHLGNIYCADGKLDDAETEFRTALTNDGKCAPAHWELARVRYYRGDPNRCLDEIKQAEKVNPLYTDSKKWPHVDMLAMRLMTAKCLEFESRNIEAVDAWKDVAGMQKNNAETNKHIADMEKVLRANVGKKRKGTQVDPQEVSALVRKGLNQVDDGDLDGAKQTFSRVLELDPQNFDGTQNTGSVLEAQGDLNGASAKYQAAMALQPKYDGCVYNFAYLLEKMNLGAEAGLKYQEFHEIAGRYPYDPKHIVALQQEDARKRARAEQLKKRGY